MAQIEAVFQGGVFKPLAEVKLAENQRVTIDVRPLEQDDPATWLAEVREMHREFLEKHGYLPDSTPDIAEDRMRDT